MAKVAVTNNRYTTESLYQWDKNQILEISGLSLPSVPEIHFTNDTMDRAIVRQASMDAAGVVTAYVPNALLQKPYKIKAYVCIYQGDSFKSEYLIEIPVVARAKPDDYSFEDDAGEIYSFNALENYVNDTVRTLKTDWGAYVADCKKAVADCEKAVADCDGVADQALAECKEHTDKAVNDILGHNHEAFDVVVLSKITSEEELDALLTEQFDGMEYNSSRRIYVNQIIPIGSIATGAHSFITIYKANNLPGCTQTASSTAQIVTTYPDGIVYRCEKNRCVNDAAWSELIWQNPPLMLNTEYATAELFNGRRVYTKRINIGNLPDNGTGGGQLLADVNHGLVIRVVGYTSDNKTIPYVEDYRSIDLCVNGNYIWVTTNYDATDVTGYVQVWYLRP